MAGSGTDCGGCGGHVQSGTSVGRYEVSGTTGGTNGGGGTVGMTTGGGSTGLGSGMTVIGGSVGTIGGKNAAAGVVMTSVAATPDVYSFHHLAALLIWPPFRETRGCVGSPVLIG